MRKQINLPKTDLHQFSSEVLSKGVIATLPQNLSDRWLCQIGRDLCHAQKAHLSGVDEKNADITVPLLIVATLLASKRNVDIAGALLSEEEIIHGFGSLHEAVVEEIVGRATGIFPYQSTIANIV